MKTTVLRDGDGRWALCLLAWLSLCLTAQAWGASPKLTVAKAAWSAKKATLTIKGKYLHAPGGASVDLYAVDGRRLGKGAMNGKGSFTLTLTGADLPTVPCSVRAQSGDLDTIKPVAGAPKFCGKTPKCQITSPADGYAANVTDPVGFSASVKLPKKLINPKYEWDFGGGAMGEDITGTGLVKTFKRPDSTDTSVQFVRNNSRYRVRFSVVDGDATHGVGDPQYRCEDSVEIVVGTPPELPAGVAPMAATAVASAPAKGNEANGTAGDLVVLPFQDWTMQHAQDGKIGGNVASPVYTPVVNTLNALVIKKGRVGATTGPQIVTGDEVTLNYSAASNPADPVGPGSINSTSQNWPLGADLSVSAPLLSSTIQKTDLWELATAPSTDTVWAHWVRMSFAQYFWAAPYTWWTTDPGLPRTDEGYFPHFTLDPSMFKDIKTYLGGASAADAASWVNDREFPYEKSFVEPILARVPAGVTHGSYMPGLANPYTSNDPQSFTLYDGDRQRFEARTIPVTDIDDQGRVNPNALLRVEALRKDGASVTASTDAVLSTGRDLHCRECHAKGQIAANPNAGYTKDSYLSSTSGKGGSWLGKPPKATPDFFTVEDIGGNPDSLFDQEYAANRNLSSLHGFYDGGAMEYFDDLFRHGYFANNIRLVDVPVACPHCHVTSLKSTPRGDTINFTDNEFGAYVGGDGASYSVSMHRFHGELQYNADKTDIVRNDKGAYVRFDSEGKARTANADINPNTLFPIFGPDGKQLPMEQNCLRCHAGHREKLYDDRMYTAGVTCFDCHGDMLAMGGAFTKDVGKSGSKMLADYRKPWFDETDCGSCHLGNGNVGKDGANGFFSAGVKKRAFDDTDPGAATRTVNKNDPDAVRFAVVPDSEFSYLDQSSTSPSADAVTVKMPVYRLGKDVHGQVACGACHGAGHQVTPNRDPNSNDNVAGLQLQGYPGHIQECKVCHTTDAFKELADLDGSTLSGLPVGVLGGPHNMHPVYDPNWWHQASGNTVEDTPNQTDGSLYGGWHNNMAKVEGKNHEDQCAACHGNDHKGTRLSKTPVDRVFDFRSFNAAKLKKAGFKKKLVKVAAGTPIGCDTCHNIATSCLGSPNANCPSDPTTSIPPPPNPGNLNPFFVTFPSVKGVDSGTSYSYDVEAKDQDGDSLSYSLIDAPAGMTLTGQTITWKPDDTAADSSAYKVVVSDGNGGTATESVTVAVCKAPKHWDVSMGMCM